jgi:hypothetical protein
MIPAVAPVMPMLASWWRRNFQGYCAPYEISSRFLRSGGGEIGDPHGANEPIPTSIAVILPSRSRRRNGEPRAGCKVGKTASSASKRSLGTRDRHPQEHQSRPDRPGGRAGEGGHSEAHFHRFFAVTHEYLDALEAGRFNLRPGFGCGMCDFRSQCRTWIG